MIIHELFPTVVGEYNLERNFTDKEISSLNNIELVENIGNYVSFNSNILDLPNLVNLKEKVEECLNEYIQTVYKPNNKIQIKVTQSWMTYSKTNQYHHKHNHPNSFLSGVLYVNTDQDVIVFSKEEYNQICISSCDYNKLNSLDWEMNAYPGCIFIFPSRLTHFVPRVKSPNPRVSIAFNSFISGDIAKNDNGSLMQLSIEEIDQHSSTSQFDTLSTFIYNGNEK